MALSFAKMRSPGKVKAKALAKNLDPDTAIIDDNSTDSLILPPNAPAAKDSGAGANAKRAEPVGNKSKRIPGSLDAAERSGFRKQIQVQLPLITVCFVIALVFVGLDTRQANDNAMLHQLVGDALTHSQRLAKSAPNAVLGNTDGVMQLGESREQLANALGALKSGDNPETGRSLSLSSQTLATVEKLDKPWVAVEAASAILIQQQKLLQSLGSLRREINESNKAMFADAQVIAQYKLQSAASAREVAAAGELVMMTQKIAKDVNQLLLGTSVNADAATALRADTTSLRDMIDTFQNGNERQRIAPLTDAESKRSINNLKAQFQKIAGPLELVLKDIDRVQAAKRAESTIFGESETLRLQLQTVQQSLRGVDARSWNIWMAALFALVGLLASFFLVRAYLNESRKRADEAEQQKGVAERLEQEAKRTNDQNQSAILRLMNELQEVADGDLTVQATVSEDITGAIADSVNYTVEELRNLVARINSTAELVNEASSKAQMIASSLQAASDQQSREIRDTGEAVLRMAQQINEVSARASESVDVARRSMGASQEGARAVQNAIAGMNGIRDQIQETAKRIKRLGESSQEIGEIVELISDITEQTNVLALNAAIQAASAGEAGRGFTVVAEEVQRLAERSGEATKQISALIRTIQTDTQDAVAAMERSTQGVVAGTKLSDEAGRALGDIGKVSTQLADLIEDFSSTTSKQAASAGTVAQSIQRILLVTEQTSEGTLQTAGSIRQLSELAQELKSSVSRFKVV